MGSKKIVIVAAAAVALGTLALSGSASAAGMANGSFFVKASSQSEGKTFEAVRGTSQQSETTPETPEDESSVMSFSLSCPAVKTPSVPAVGGFRGTATWSFGSEREVIQINSDADLLKLPNFWSDEMEDFNNRNADEINRAILEGDDVATVVEQLIEAEPSVSYSISYEGDFAPVVQTSIPNSSAPPYALHSQCLTSVDRWENTGQTDASLVFLGFGNLRSVVEPPKSITRMESMFRGAQLMTQDISGWDVSNVTDWDEFAGGSGLTTDKIPAKFR